MAESFNITRRMALKAIPFMGSAVAVPAVSAHAETDPFEPAMRHLEDRFMKADADARRALSENDSVLLIHVLKKISSIHAAASNFPKSYLAIALMEKAQNWSLLLRDGHEIRPSFHISHI